jgi:SAM-dependent methyltransferase
LRNGDGIFGALREPEKILKEIWRVTKPGGRFFATVPFIWNLHEIPFDEYRYTPYSLERHLVNAGYKNVEIKALGGWNRSVAQMIGLWLTFSTMHRFARLILSYLLFPVYVLLIKTDRRPTRFDGGENSMFSGLSVTAGK